VARAASGPRSALEHEGERALAGAAAVADVGQDQLGLEDAVAVVAGLAGEVELGGEDGAVGGLDLDVDVAGAAGVDARQDRLQAPGAVGVAELVAPQAVALGVVLAGVVGLPEVEQGPLDRAAVGGQDGPGDDQALAAQTEGPYFTPSSPERASLLEAGMGGRRLVVAGAVLTTDCRPVQRALLDFWQADDAGHYDNQGYRLRGHQFSDAKGAWRLETVVPGLYTGPSRHLHVKVQAPDGPVLTTQLYFPGEPANDRDGIFSPKLLLADLRDVGGARQGSFTFVLAG
jgi:hypothetical protein